MKTKAIFLISLLLVLAGCIDEETVIDEPTPEFESFPQFTLTAHDGSNNTLEDMSDTYWLAYFSAPWCTHCETTLDSYDQVIPAGKLMVFSKDSSNEYSDMSAWHNDTEENLNRTVARPFMLAPELAESLEVGGIPHAIIVDSDGNMITEKVGKSPDVNETTDWWNFFTN